MLGKCFRHQTLKMSCLLAKTLSWRLLFFHFSIFLSSFSIVSLRGHKVIPELLTAVHSFIIIIFLFLLHLTNLPLIFLAAQFFSKWCWFGLYDTDMPQSLVLFGMQRLQCSYQIRLYEMLLCAADGWMWVIFLRSCFYQHNFLIRFLLLDLQLCIPIAW